MERRSDSEVPSRPRLFEVWSAERPDEKFQVIAAFSAPASLESTDASVLVREIPYPMLDRSLVFPQEAK